MKNTFDSVFEIDETYESSNWLKTKIRTFAFGRNRNGSDILDSSLTNFTKARSSIGAVPIVAKYNDETDNLEGHNVSMRKNKDDEYEIYYNTDALGFTSPTASFYLEEVNEGTDANPDYKTYVVIEDVYLWKRFDATKKIIEWFKEGIAPRVSMEIDQVEGRFDRDGYFQIHDFVFTGIAALGTDVEPAFPRAEIQTYTVNEFREELKTLMSELSTYSMQEGGTEQMPTEKETEVVKDEKTDVVETVEETEVVEVTEVEESQTTEEAKENDTPDAPEGSTDAPKSADEETPADDTEEVVEKTDDAEDEQKEPEEEVEPEVDFEAKFNELSDAHEQLKADYTSLQSELSELQTYKRQREESDLKAKFEGKLSDEEFNQVFTELKDEPLENVEEKLFALIGKKNFSIQSTKETNLNKVTVLSPKEKVYNPYGEIFD